MQFQNGTDTTITTAKTTMRLLATAIALCAALVLAACSGQPSTSSQATSETSSTPAAASGSLDVSSWTTLADAYAVASESPAYSYDNAHWVSVFRSGDSVVRVVADLDLAAPEKLADLDMSSADFTQQLTQLVGGMKLVSAEDITAKQLDQTTLDSYVGKTGQDLLDEGFEFESYFFYGGEQTGASLGKDYFSYEFTFDGTTSESATEDGGESIKGYTVVEAATNGNYSMNALDPTLV